MLLGKVGFNAFRVWSFDAEGQRVKRSVIHHRNDHMCHAAVYQRHRWAIKRSHTLRIQGLLKVFPVRVQVRIRVGALVAI